MGLTASGLRGVVWYYDRRRGEKCQQACAYLGAKAAYHHETPTIESQRKSTGRY